MLGGFRATLKLTTMNRQRKEMIVRMLNCTTDARINQIKWKAKKYISPFRDEPEEDWTIKVWSMTGDEPSSIFSSLDICTYIPSPIGKYIEYNTDRKICELVIY
jgi:hypothetical protein